MSMGDAPRRPWLRWLLMSVFVVALAVTFVNLGRWQLDRLDQRRERNDTVAQHEAAPVQPFDKVFTHEITEADQWQKVQVRGTFDAGRQLLVRYRSNAGDTGWEVVTPLRLESGDAVLVDRGFVRRRGDEDFPAVLPEPPAGAVTVVGHVRRNEQGPRNAVVPAQGAVRLINSEAIAEGLPYRLANGYIGLLTVEPAQSGGFVAVQPPDLTEGPHLSYALQWFSFAVIAGVGMVILIRGDLEAKRKAARRADRDDG